MSNITNELGTVLDMTQVESTIATCIHELVDTHNVSPERVVSIIEHYMTHLREQLST